MFESIVNLFFPKICAGCAQLLLPQETLICVRCRHDLPQTYFHYFPHNEAMQKFYGKVPIEFAATFLFYHKKGIVQNLIQNLKYKNQPQIGRCLGDWYGHELLPLAQSLAFDVVIPVPLHAKRLKERGYNQVATFGQALADSIAIPYQNNLLRRTTYSSNQTKKNLGSRTTLAQETKFEVRYTKADENLHFLVVDDVLTTGSTLEGCVRALRTIPGAKVSILCMAISA